MQTKGVAAIMYNGKVRVYGYPSVKGKFDEWKFFDEECRLF